MSRVGGALRISNQHEPIPSPDLSKHYSLQARISPSRLPVFNHGLFSFAQEAAGTASQARGTRHESRAEMQFSWEWPWICKRRRGLNEVVRVVRKPGQWLFWDGQAIPLAMQAVVAGSTPRPRRKRHVVTGTRPAFVGLAPFASARLHFLPSLVVILQQMAVSRATCTQLSSIPNSSLASSVRWRKYVLAASFMTLRNTCGIVAIVACENVVQVMPWVDATVNMP
jgi:hypothetical protein